MSNKNVKYILTIIIILIFFFTLYFVLKHFTNKKSNEETYLKNYGVNEYIPSYVSDESMAKIYLNDFKNNMLYNTEDSYYMLDEEYRNEKFGTYDAYKKYVQNINYDIKLSKFYKTSKDGYIYFGVYDASNNLYLFKTKGVMQYTVFLDDETIEIW